MFLRTAHLVQYIKVKIRLRPIPEIHGNTLTLENTIKINLDFQSLGELWDKEFQRLMHI